MESSNILDMMKYACRAKEIKGLDDPSMYRNIKDIVVKDANDDSLVTVEKITAIGSDVILRSIILMHANKISEMVFGTPAWSGLKFQINKNSLAGAVTSSVPESDGALLKQMLFGYSVDKLSVMTPVGLDFSKGADMVSQWVHSLNLEQGDLFTVDDITSITPYHLSDIPNAMRATDPHLAPSF